MSATTVEDALQTLARRLGAVGIEDARREAQVLLGHVLGKDRAYLHAFPEIVLKPEQIQRLDALADRRAKRVPMSQVLGSREFWSLAFRVTGDTLTPRPDSETLIEAALAQFQKRTPPQRIADLGTGTGCLLISLLSEWPASRGLGIDRSPEALLVARENALRCGMADRTDFAEGVWFDCVSDQFDLIVSNPPYIPAGDLAALEPEVSRHEPRLALDGGEDGLDAYRAILPELSNHLSEDGIAVLEHGAGQGPDLDALALGYGLEVVVRCSDLAGQRRCMVLVVG